VFQPVVRGALLRWSLFGMVWHIGRPAMKVNAFEGARRIAILFGIIWAVGCVALVGLATPYVSLTYETLGPNLPFTKTDAQCETRDRSEYLFNFAISESESITIKLCFRAQSFSNDRWLIPYKLDDSSFVWGDGPYSNKVTNYAEQRKTSFALPLDDRKLAIEQLSEKRWENRWSAAKTIVIGWGVLAMLTWVIGWIVRGFLGIPRGKDP
jgi:hypothetical protein